MSHLSETISIKNLLIRNAFVGDYNEISLDETLLSISPNDFDQNSETASNTPQPTDSDISPPAYSSQIIESAAFKALLIKNMNALKPIVTVNDAKPDSNPNLIRESEQSQVTFVKPQSQQNQLLLNHPKLQYPNANSVYSVNNYSAINSQPSLNSIYSQLQKQPPQQQQQYSIQTQTVSQHLQQASIYSRDPTPINCQKLINLWPKNIREMILQQSLVSYNSENDMKKQQHSMLTTPMPQNQFSQQSQYPQSQINNLSQDSFYKTKSFALTPLQPPPELREAIKQPAELKPAAAKFLFRAAKIEIPVQIPAKLETLSKNDFYCQCGQTMLTQQELINKIKIQSLLSNANYNPKEMKASKSDSDDYSMTGIGSFNENELPSLSSKVLKENSFF